MQILIVVLLTIGTLTTSSRDLSLDRIRLMSDREVQTLVDQILIHLEQFSEHVQDSVKRGEMSPKTLTDAEINGLLRTTESSFRKAVGTALVLCPKLRPDQRKKLQYMCPVAPANIN